MAISFCPASCWPQYQGNFSPADMRESFPACYHREIFPLDNGKTKFGLVLAPIEMVTRQSHRKAPQAALKPQRLQLHNSHEETPPTATGMPHAAVFMLATMRPPHTPTRKSNATATPYQRYMYVARYPSQRDSALHTYAREGWQRERTKEN